MLGGTQRQYQTLQERTLLCMVSFGARQGDKDRRESDTGSNLQPKKARVRKRASFEFVCARLCLLNAFLQFTTRQISMLNAFLVCAACLEVRIIAKYV